MAGIRVIAVPYELGRLRDGVGLGPEALLEGGAAEALAAAGAEVETELIELDQRFDNEVDATFALAAKLAERVRAAREDEVFPVVLSGSCFAAVGVVAGLDEPSPGVIWFDAHGDFNEPETSPSGYLDGMGLSVLTGSAWQALRETVDEAAPVPESAVVLAGARDLDLAEAERLDAAAIARLSSAALREPSELTAAATAMLPPASGIYLHLDLDVLDLAEARVNRYSVAGGLTAAELERLVATAFEELEIRAVSLTAYEPDLDPEARVPRLARGVLGEIGVAVAGGGQALDLIR